MSSFRDNVLITKYSSWNVLQDKFLLRNVLTEDAVIGGIEQRDQLLQVLGFDDDDAFAAGYFDAGALVVDGVQVDGPIDLLPPKNCSKILSKYSN